MPGDLLEECAVDLVYANDNLVRIIDRFREMGGTRVWDPAKVIVAIDHWAPPESVLSAENQRKVRQFCREQGIRHFFDAGEGIGHQLLAESGLVRSGDLIVGSDSHIITQGALGAASAAIGATEVAAVFLDGRLWLRVPSTIKITFTGHPQDGVFGKDLILFAIGRFGTDFARYRALEFSGDAIRYLPMDDRLTLCNMGVEMGAKFAVIAPDTEPCSGRIRPGQGSIDPVRPDPDAEYEVVEELHAGEISPQIAEPHSPANTKPVHALAGTRINRVFIGGCTNGRLTDLAAAAGVLKERRVHSDVRLYVTPASRKVLKDALDAGHIRTLVESGAVITNPGCGACFGGHLGVLGPGDVCVSTTNRNFRGRMGSREAQIFLANPAVAAASAVAGEIAEIPRIDRW